MDGLLVDLSWIRYDKAPVRGIPSNFVAIGDSVMVVNPTFGCAIPVYYYCSRQWVDAVCAFVAKGAPRLALVLLLSIASCARPVWKKQRPYRTNLAPISSNYMRIRYLAPGMVWFCTSPTHALKAPSCCADVGKGQSPPVRRSTFSYHISDRGYCAPNTDYQWSTTRPVKGEALSDERFAGEFANTIMQLARTVSLPNFWSFLDITASSDTCASIWNKGQERWFGTLACSVLLGATDDTHAAVRVVEGGAFQGEGSSRLSSWKIDANHDTHTYTEASSFWHML